MITFVCWLWNAGAVYDFRHVAALSRAIAANYSKPHRFVCVTNAAGGGPPGIEIVPDREDFADIPSPHGGNNPSCYRRLRLFESNAAETFGERIVSMDLDAVILRDITPLFDRDEDFVGWLDPLWAPQLCGSLMMLRAGSRPLVWELFRPTVSPEATRNIGLKGSDQAWISYALGWTRRGVARWTSEDGVYNAKWDLKYSPPPANARIVFFTGKVKPWHPDAPAWAREHWRATK